MQERVFEVDLLPAKVPLPSPGGAWRLHGTTIGAPSSQRAVDLFFGEGVRLSSALCLSLPRGSYCLAASLCTVAEWLRSGFENGWWS